MRKEEVARAEEEGFSRRKDVSEKRKLVAR